MPEEELSTASIVGNIDVEMNAPKITMFCEKLNQYHTVNESVPIRGILRPQNDVQCKRSDDRFANFDSHTLLLE